MPRPWAFMYSRVFSSEGKIEVVAPSSAPMLVMVARSVAERLFTPGPVYSRILPTAALDRQAAQNLQDDVLGGDPGLESCPLSSTRKTLGMVM